MEINNKAEQTVLTIMIRKLIRIGISKDDIMWAYGITDEEYEKIAKGEKNEAL